MRKPSLKQAIIGTIRTWREVERLAKEGKWEEARKFLRKTERQCRTKYGQPCLFCALHDGYSTQCELGRLHWCSKGWHNLPAVVCGGYMDGNEALECIHIIVSTLSKMKQELPHAKA
jgi:hypothetical protein